jgi:hypothetical protein
LNARLYSVFTQPSSLTAERNRTLETPSRLQRRCHYSRNHMHLAEHMGRGASFKRVVLFDYREEVATECIALNKFDDARLKKIHGSIIRNGSAASSLCRPSFKCRGKSANPMNRVFDSLERTTPEQPLPAIISCKTRFSLKASTWSVARLSP